MNGVKDQELKILFESFTNQEYFQEYERAVIFRLGRLLSGGARGPGVFFIIPCVDIYEKIDMRTATYEIPPQEILTKDSVTVFVNAIMYYKVRVSPNMSMKIMTTMLSIKQLPSRSQTQHVLWRTWTTTVDLPDCSQRPP